MRRASAVKPIPEVEHVFGKVGRADTATVPAAISMIETFITLKPRDRWRPAMTSEKLITEMKHAARCTAFKERGACPSKPTSTC